jgi:hypothetical protein
VYEPDIQREVPNRNPRRMCGPDPSTTSQCQAASRGLVKHNRVKSDSGPYPVLGRAEEARLLLGRFVSVVENCEYLGWRGVIGIRPSWTSTGRLTFTILGLLVENEVVG